MESIGPRQSHGSSRRALTAAVGALAACAIAASLMRIALAMRRTAEREAEREAELDVWAYSDSP